MEDSEVDITLAKDGTKILADVDGRKYELEASEPEKDSYLLKYNKAIYEVYVLPGESGDGLTRVKLGSDEFEILLSDPKRLRGSGSVAAGNAGIVELKTAMPGKVVRILLSEGSEAKQGDGVIVVEAMKMQNEMKSPKDGVVKEIRFSEGDTVNAGDVLAVIE